MQGRVSHIHPSGDITVDLLGMLNGPLIKFLRKDFYMRNFCYSLDPRIKRHARGKFELLEEEEGEEMEEEPQEEYESTVTYSWNQMIEPRLIFP